MGMQGSQIGLKSKRYFGGGESVIGCDELNDLRWTANEDRSILGRVPSENQYLVASLLDYQIFMKSRKPLKSKFLL